MDKSSQASKLIIDMMVLMAKQNRYEEIFDEDMIKDSLNGLIDNFTKSGIEINPLTDIYVNSSIFSKENFCSIASFYIHLDVSLNNNQFSAKKLYGEKCIDPNDESELDSIIEKYMLFDQYKKYIIDNRLIDHKELKENELLLKFPLLDHQLVPVFMDILDSKFNLRNLIEKEISSIQLPEFEGFSRYRDHYIETLKNDTARGKNLVGFYKIMKDEKVNLTVYDDEDIIKEKITNGGYNSSISNKLFNINELINTCLNDNISHKYKYNLFDSIKYIFKNHSLEDIFNVSSEHKVDLFLSTSALSVRPQYVGEKDKSPFFDISVERAGDFLKDDHQKFIEFTTLFKEMKNVNETNLVKLNKDDLFCNILKMYAFEYYADDKCETTEEKENFNKELRLRLSPISYDLINESLGKSKELDHFIFKSVISYTNTLLSTCRYTDLNLEKEINRSIKEVFSFLINNEGLYLDYLKSSNHYNISDLIDDNYVLDVFTTSIGNELKTTFYTNKNINFLHNILNQADLDPINNLTKYMIDQIYSNVRIYENGLIVLSKFLDNNKIDIFTKNESGQDLSKSLENLLIKDYCSNVINEKIEKMIQTINARKMDCIKEDVMDKSVDKVIFDEQDFL